MRTSQGALVFAFAILLATGVGLRMPCAHAAETNAAGPGTAEGMLTLDRSPTVLTRAYAREFTEILEMRIDDWPERTIMVILTDRPLPENRRFSYAKSIELSFAGEIRGLVLQIDPSTGTVRSGRTLLPQTELPQFFTVAGEPPAVVLEGFEENRAAGTVAGRAVTPLPIEVVNFDNRPGPARFSFDVSFVAELRSAPKLLQTLEGDAARESEPGRALKRFFDAVAAADPKAIADAVVSDHPALTMLDPNGMAQMRQMVLNDGASPDAIYGDLVRVYIYESGAKAVLKSEGGWSSYALTQEGEGWKLGEP